MTAAWKGTGPIPDTRAVVRWELEEVRSELSTLRKEIADTRDSLAANVLGVPRVSISKPEPYVIQDNDDQNGTTWVHTWKLGQHQVDATWTSERSEALVFEHRDTARLVAHCVGGSARPVRTRVRKRKKA